MLIDKIKEIVGKDLLKPNIISTDCEILSLHTICGNIFINTTKGVFRMIKSPEGIIWEKIWDVKTNESSCYSCTS